MVTNKCNTYYCLLFHSKDCSPSQSFQTVKERILYLWHMILSHLGHISFLRLLMHMSYIFVLRQYFWSLLFDWSDRIVHVSSLSLVHSYRCPPAFPSWICFRRLRYPFLRDKEHCSPFYVNQILLSPVSLQPRKEMRYLISPRSFSSYEYLQLITIFRRPWPVSASP